MSWPVPAPGEIASRAAAVFEGALPGIDARSPNTVAGAISRVTDMALADVYFELGYLAAELMPDTAIDTLDRHANTWGVPRLQPTAAIGNASFAGTVGAPIPAGLTFTAPSRAVVATAAAGTIGGGGTVVLPLVAAVAGSNGNQPGGTVLTIVSPLAGLNPQSCTLDGFGLSAGTDIEPIEAWRARILRRIRAPAMGGAAADYTTWVNEVLSGTIVQPVPNGGGLGTVVVWITQGMTVASPAEVALVQAYLDVVRPVTAAVTVLAASLVPVNVTLHLSPDTAAIRAAAINALALAFVQDAAIGGTVFVSRLDNAVSSSDGEYSHERSLPSADVVMSAGQLPVLGTVSFV